MRLLVETTGESYEFDGLKTKSLESPNNAEEVEPQSLMAQLQAIFILGRVARTGLLAYLSKVKKLVFPKED